MKIRPLNIFLVLLIEAIVAGAIIAQDPSAPIYPDTAHPTPAPNSDQYAPPAMNQNTGQNDMPVFRVTVSERTTKAVNYRNRGGSTMVDFRGTDLLPGVEGHAKVDSKNGRMTINIELKHMPQAHLFGGQFLTYVLWAITPEGRAVNLGEVVPGDSGKDKLPSSQASLDVPLDLLEARNALAIAKAAGAQQYATDSLTKAEDMLQRAEDYYQRKQGITPIGTAARGATQMAEDARVLTLRREREAKIEADRRAHEEAEAQAKIPAPEAQQQAAQAQAQADEDARRRAAAERAEADALAQQQQAAAQQAQAQAAAAAAQQAAHQAEQQRQEAINQKEEMRQRLLAQLNQVLQTRDTARGLIVSMPDVLFAFNQHTLKPEARERLARISGIVLAYPDLKLEIDGYTDAIGSDDYNQTLSDKRAEAVRDYLVNAGVSMNNVVARGLGKSDPVADNTTAAGRQLNRRVEMIVSGDVIGTQLNPNTEGGPAQSTMNRQ